jgi:hypothetical protein
MPSSGLLLRVALVRTGYKRNISPPSPWSDESSNISVLIRTTRRYVPEDGILLLFSVSMSTLCLISRLNIPSLCLYVLCFPNE